MHILIKAIANITVVLLRQFLPLGKQNSRHRFQAYCMSDSRPRKIALHLAMPQPTTWLLLPLVLLPALLFTWLISILHAKPNFYVIPSCPSSTTWKAGMLRDTSATLHHVFLIPFLPEVRNSLFQVIEDRLFWAKEEQSTQKGGGPRGIFGGVPGVQSAGTGLTCKQSLAVIRVAGNIHRVEWNQWSSE